VTFADVSFARLIYLRRDIPRRQLNDVTMAAIIAGCMNLVLAIPTFENEGFELKVLIFLNAKNLKLMSRIHPLTDGVGHE
jgi:hypothetical protein